MFFDQGSNVFCVAAGSAFCVGNCALRFECRSGTNGDPRPLPATGQLNGRCHPLAYGPVNQWPSALWFQPGCAYKYRRLVDGQDRPRGAVTGLTPDTLYYYSVGNTNQVLAGGDSSHFFVTAPPTGVAQPTRIWVIGDSGTADANAVAVRDAYLNFTGARHTDCG